MVKTISGITKNQWMKRGSGLYAKPNPTFPRQGLQFYADLWHPDQQAIGNLINGTGIATEAPAILAVGNNTINVTTQGTFIIYVRDSGTATSGTATVTGSPKTLVSGHNTITVTGTGTITVALNNVIVSKDINAHLLTITGATWGYQGRTFDGDDLISVPNATALNITGGMSWEMWVYCENHDSTTKRLLMKSDTGFQDTPYGFTLYQVNAGANPVIFARNYNGVTNISAVATITKLAWHQIFGVYNGTNTLIYADGNYVAISVGTIASLTTNNNNLEIGGGDTDRFFIGKIGEMLIYSRALSASEIMGIYERTKWRYQ